MSIFNDKKFNYFFLLLTVGVFFIYLPAITGTPIWDDKIYFFNENYFNETGGITNIFLKHRWALFTLIILGLQKVFGDLTWPYHLLNIVLHILNSVLFFQILKRSQLKGKYWIMLVFAFHPAHITSVAWMIQLKTIFSTSFMLLSGWWLLNYFHTTRKKFIYLSVLIYSLSLFIKSSTIVFPALLLGYTFLFNRKYLWTVIPFGIVSIGYLLYFVGAIDFQHSTNIVRKSYNKQPGEELSILLTLQIFSYYLKQAFFPFNLTTIYGKFPDKNTIAILINLIPLTFIATLIWKRKILIFLLFFVTAISPFLAFIKAPYMSITQVSDQHLYIPLLITSIFIAYVICNLKMKVKFKNAIISFLIIAFLIYGHLFAYNYQSEKQFYKTALDNNPHIHVAYINLATSYMDKQKWDKARKILYKGLEVLKKDCNCNVQKHPLYFYFEHQFNRLYNSHNFH